MKKITTCCCILTLALGLTACGSTPSDAEIKQALEDGTITVEDAKSKGWIDEKWILENFEQVESQSKIYLFDAFETTYLDGTPASSDIIHDTMCLVFFDTSQEQTMKKLSVYIQAQPDMEAVGVPVLGIVTDENLDAARQNLQDINFPVIVYNDAMQQSMQNYKEMIEQDLTAVFTRDGGFYTAWYTSATIEDLVETAQGLVNTD